MNLRKTGESGRLHELTREVCRYTTAHGGTGPFVTAIEGFCLLRSERAKPPSHRIFTPALCITLQGAKWATFGENRYEYRAGQALVVSVEMPSRGTVAVASPAEPFLGIAVEFDRVIMQDIREALGGKPKPSSNEKARGALVIDVSPQLADCALRSLRLLQTPEAIPALYPGIMREMCYRLLTGPDGGRIAHMTLKKGHERGVLEAIHDLRSRFTQPIRVDDLAVTARMSPATFHRQFKSVTSMTPLQYQKQLRLLDARRLMIAGNANVESAAFQVGYESASQFSREYTRMFGRSPRRDILALNAANLPTRRPS